MNRAHNYIGMGADADGEGLRSHTLDDPPDNLAILGVMI